MKNIIIVTVGTIIIDLLGYRGATLLMKSPDLAFNMLGGALLTFCIAITLLSVVTLLTPLDTL